MDRPRVISMEVAANGRSDCHFRIRAGRGAKYVTVKAGALDAEALDDMPLDFENILPPLDFYSTSWKSASIVRTTNTQELEAALSSENLPAVKSIWHPRLVDCFDIERTEFLTLLAQECKWVATDEQPQVMVAKMARFGWEVPYIEAETRMYQVLEGKGIAPGFLGHVHEEGRVMGILLEKVPDGRLAGPGDLERCQAALGRLHALVYLHGDCNKYNFLVRPGGDAVLVDFDKTRKCGDRGLLEAEMASLPAQLAEKTGRGGGLIFERDFET
ncbi:alpha-galactosidase A [Colletotrichum plurivorum]|uniref:Alpha-galactosidase A n=1 Tax=Colletotrichum plurivorum TaxID=2175906 RepID=A0A8H6JZK2_9PEZI|nr:alpha-galactosidase A [Colletotrichum plurivorum]